jgi:hypothetical protein
MLYMWTKESQRSSRCPGPRSAGAVAPRRRRSWRVTSDALPLRFRGLRRPASERRLGVVSVPAAQRSLAVVPTLAFCESSCCSSASSLAKRELSQSASSPALWNIHLTVSMDLDPAPAHRLHSQTEARMEVRARFAESEMKIGPEWLQESLSFAARRYSAPRCKYIFHHELARKGSRRSKNASRSGKIA